MRIKIHNIGSKFMRDVEAVLQHAEEYCIGRGVKLTPKRKRVLSGLIGSSEALSAYDLIDYCKKEFGDAMPAMSVYRILNFLEREKLVHRLQLANKYVACSHITCDHAHGASQFLICGECNKVKEIAISALAMDELQANVDSAGFRMAGTQLEVNCICEACAP
ncbi:transcriptional repressor [Burkholderiales bacterium]|jgi:Fur family zinc uptake transcriptional regulator|nr:transcriptional repressor [Burkholderiales bacterium]